MKYLFTAVIDSLILRFKNSCNVLNFLLQIREQPAGVLDARNEITRQLAKDWNALPQHEREVGMSSLQILILSLSFLPSVITSLSTLTHFSLRNNLRSTCITRGFVLKPLGLDPLDPFPFPSTPAPCPTTRVRLSTLHVCDFHLSTEILWEVPW